MNQHPSPSYSITIKIEINNRIGMFAQVAQAISEAGGDIGSVNIAGVEKGKIIREITVDAYDEQHELQIVAAVGSIKGIKVLHVMDRTFTAHQGGKIEVHSRMPIRDSNELSKVYTPGVARICRDIHKSPEHAYRYTIKGNSIAIVTDGTAVLGLGDIGPMAAMPVMEGKAMIFKEFAGIDAFPIALSTTKPEEIINTIKNIAPAFGGINLEDISAPRCFEIESELRKLLDIPVMHDDQHGTAVVILAGLINISRLQHRNIKKLKVVISGSGAAGTAAAYMLSAYGIKNIIVCDQHGAIFKGRREHMNNNKKVLAKDTNPHREKGTIAKVLQDAHIFIGLSVPNVISADDIKAMSKRPIVFALANPDPEISPEEALPLVSILATGRSDYPNQVNNMLSYPGIFRGLLDVRAKGVNEEIKLAAAKAIAHTIKDDELHEDYIIPSIFNKEVVAAVAGSVAEAARKSGIARK